MPYESEFADRIMRHEGIGAHSVLPPCESCGVRTGAAYRCMDCSPSEFSCKECAVDEHLRHPLHKIEVHCVRCCIPLTNSPPFSNGTVSSLRKRLSLI